MRHDFLESVGMLMVDFHKFDEHGKMVPGSKQQRAIMYNKNVISQDEVLDLLNKNRIFSDERVIITSLFAAQAFLTGFYPPVQGEVS